MPQPDPYGLGPLFERWRAGDVSARDALLGGHVQPYLKVKVRAWLGPELARRLDESSIAQESVVRMLKNEDGFRGQSVPELLGWAQRIAFNVAADRRERLAAGPLATGEALNALPDDGPAPLAVLIHEEDAARLARALEALPAPRREVVLARLIDGLSFEEIAERMGRKSGAVRVLFHRAVKQLREILENGP